MHVLGIASAGGSGGFLASYATRWLWFAGRKGFDRLFAAIYSRIFQPRREGVEAPGPLLREGLSLGCASHAVCRTLGTIGNVRDALDKFVQFVFGQRNGNAGWVFEPDDPLPAHRVLEIGKTVRNFDNFFGIHLVDLSR